MAMHQFPWSKLATTQVSLSFYGTRSKIDVELSANTLGNFAKALVQVDPGQNLLGFGSMMSWNEWVLIWGRVMKIPDSYGKESTRSNLNETVLPDEFLLTWLPTFLIRHPALAFPSLYRAVLELEGTGDPDTDASLGEHCMTMRWTRSLYDLYARKFGTEGFDSPWPIILDADDIMTEPEVVTAFCKIVCLDPSKLSFSWMPATEEQQAQIDPCTKRYLSTLLASGGIVKEKTAANLDVEREAKKWRKEFGDRAGERIERLVREAMPDYEFMKARRLTTKSSA